MCVETQRSSARRSALTDVSALHEDTCWISGRYAGRREGPQHTGKPCGQLTAPGPGHCPSTSYAHNKSICTHRGEKGISSYSSKKPPSQSAQPDTSRRNPLPLSRSKPVSSQAHRNTPVKIGLINSPKF